jgi:hypothetical protein
VSISASTSAENSWKIAIADSAIGGTLLFN